MTRDIPPLPPPATPLSPRKRAILIGASSGIGAALARQLATEGWTLALLARREEMLSSLSSEINAMVGEVRAVPYPHDVTRTEEVPTLLRKIISEIGGLDMIVYDTGSQVPVARDEFNFDKDIAMLETNFLGALAWLNPVAALFQNMGAGTIVALGSVAGDRGRVGSPAYNASKAALHTYLEALRNRLARRGIHVLTVKPGYVRTDLLRHSPPRFLTASAEQAAADIRRAIHRRRQQVYTPWFWGWIMFIVRNIPSVVFRRMSF